MSDRPPRRAFIVMDDGTSAPFPLGALGEQRRKAAERGRALRARPRAVRLLDVVCGDCPGQAPLVGVVEQVQSRVMLLATSIGVSYFIAGEQIADLTPAAGDVVRLSPVTFDPAPVVGLCRSGVAVGAWSALLREALKATPGRPRVARLHHPVPDRV